MGIPFPACNWGEKTTRKMTYKYKGTKCDGGNTFLLFAFLHKEQNRRMGNAEDRAAGRVSGPGQRFPLLFETPGHVEVEVEEVQEEEVVFGRGVVVGDGGGRNDLSDSLQFHTGMIFKRRN